MKVLIIGKGNVGKAIGFFYEKKHDVAYIDYQESIEELRNTVEVIHICYPYKEMDLFCTSVRDYINYYNPSKAIIIESSVPPHIFSKIENQIKGSCILFHSPVRATTPDMKSGLQSRPKYFGISQTYKRNLMKYGTRFLNKTNESIKDQIYVNITQFFDEYVKGIEMPCIFNFDITAEELAAAKILMTNWYGMEIAFVQMIKMYCSVHDYDFDFVYTEYQRTTPIGKEYKLVGDRAVATEEISRPILIPGIIGGNCVIPDIKIARSYSMGHRDLWSWILDCNERMKSEIKKEIKKENICQTKN